MKTDNEFDHQGKTRAQIEYSNRMIIYSLIGLGVLSIIGGIVHLIKVIT